MKKKKDEKCKGGSILKTVSYGTGALVRNVKNLGKIVETKPFKKVVSDAGDLCGTVSDKTKVALVKVQKTFKKNMAAVQESFEEGMASVTDPAEDTAGTGAPAPELKEKAGRAAQKTKGKKTAKKKAKPEAENKIEETKKDTTDA